MTLRSFLYPKIPLWISPIQTVSNPLTSAAQTLVYATLLDNEGLLKTFQQLEQLGMGMDWWHYNQVLSIYSVHKKAFGFLHKSKVFDAV